MSDLSHFKRLVYEPETRELRNALRHRQQELNKIEGLLDEVLVPQYTTDGDRLKTFGRVARLVAAYRELESRAGEREAVEAMRETGS